MKNCYRKSPDTSSIGGFLHIFALFLPLGLQPYAFGLNKRAPCNFLNGSFNFTQEEDFTWGRASPCKCGEAAFVSLRFAKGGFSPSGENQGLARPRSPLCKLFPSSVRTHPVSSRKINFTASHSCIKEGTVFN